MQEKVIEQNKDLYIVFIDFRKTFDTVDRELLWKVVRASGCPEHLVDMIRLFHDGAEGKVAVLDRRVKSSA